MMIQVDALHSTSSAPQKQTKRKDAPTAAPSTKKKAKVTGKSSKPASHSRAAPLPPMAPPPLASQEAIADQPIMPLVTTPYQKKEHLLMIMESTYR